MNIMSWVDKKNGCKHHGAVLESKNGFDIIECKECKFKHIIPIPSNEELKDLYTHEYYDLEKPLYIEDYKEDQDWHDVVNSERYNNFENFLNTKHNRILDIGSGPGLFLKCGLQRGWNVFGIEPSIQAYEHSIKLLGKKNLFNGIFNEETYQNFGIFDVVNLNLVLEHIPNPRELVTLAKSVLKKGGLINISVPNDFNPFQKILQENLNFSPWWIQPPHHINYFNHESLSTLLKGQNFEIVYETSSFPIDIFLLMGENYVNDNKKGREAHKKRKKFDINIAKSKVSKEIYKAFSNLGLGREVITLGRK